MKIINHSFHFNIGSFDCSVIRDTISPMELEFLFSNTPVDQLKQLLNQYQIQPGKVMDVMCLFIRTPDHNILIDTGWGFSSQPDTGNLIENLQLEKIQPEEIDTIILSHGHPDHIGGITDAKNGLVFPNARYFMGKKAWEYWTSEPDLTQFDKNIAHTMLTTARKNLVPIKDRLSLIDSDTEIIPGVEYMRTPGHSPDHGVLVISSENEHLLYSSDLFHHPLQLARPDLCTALDLTPEQAIRMRTKMIRRVIAANMMVFACHFPFPGIGYIISKGDTFLWQPI